MRRPCFSRATTLAAPLALALLLGAVHPAATMCRPASYFAKAHTWDDNDLDGMTSAGDTLHYTIVFCEPGAGNRRCAFEDQVGPELTLDGASVRCVPDTGTTPPGFCAESPAGSGVVVVDYAPNRMDLDSCVTVTFDATVAAVPPAGVCNQAVNRVDRNDLSNDDCQGLVPAPDLEVVKTARLPQVQPGAPAVFDVTLRNVGTEPLADARLFDLLDPCFVPFGPNGAPCDPGVVACTGPACAAASCVYAAGGAGFNLTGLDLAAHDAFPGGPDEVTLAVTAIAGPTDGPCTNTAETSDPDSPSLVDTATVTIFATPQLEIAKTALAPWVEPGLGVDFDVVLHNLGAAPIAGVVVDDTLDACFAPLGVAGAPCDPLVVTCSGVGCTGTTCVYTNGGLGFTLSGIALSAEDGAPGGPDEVAVRVAATAGAVEVLACRNRAETSDPDSPLLFAEAEVEILVPRPELEIEKTALVTLAAPGTPVDFDIVVRNVGLAPLASGTLADLLEPCFLPLGIDTAPCAAAAVSCTGAGCAPATCVYSGGGQGFTLSGFSLAASDGAPGGADEITMRVTATTGGTSGPCVNQAETSDPTSPSLIAMATVEIGLRADLAITKDTTTPTVVPGGAADFTIVVHNAGNAPHVAGTLVDALESCFAPLGAIGDPCAPAVVSCSGSGCAAVTCVYAGGGLGFNLSGFSLAADDAAPGGDDEIRITLRATAGPTPGACDNTATTSDPDSPVLADSATVDIVAAPGCDLMDGDLTFPPLSPDPATLYTRACLIAGARLSRVNTVAPAPGDLADGFAGPAGSLRLYQLDCPCAAAIELTKNLGTGRVRLSF